MHLCYSINDFSAMPAGISLLSFLENNPDYEPEEVFFVDFGIRPPSRRRLEAVAARYGKRITYLQHKEVTDQIRRDFPHLHTWRGTMAPNAKAFLDRIVPEYVHRLLFIDADTLVTDSLRELADLDMGGAAVAAVPQGWETQQIRQGRLRLCCDCDFYFNSGILLYDMDVWRREDCYSMVIDVLRKKKEFYSPDQTLLNNTIPGRLRKPLPLRYNHLTHHYHPKQEPDNLRRWGVFSEEEIEEAIKHPAIVHFTGGDHHARPWHEGCWSYRKEEYLRYKALSPWKDVPLLPRERSLRPGLYGKGMRLYLWMISRQPSTRLSNAVGYLNHLLLRIDRRMNWALPSMAEGVESSTPTLP